jgi:hypothetical protein
MTNEELQLDMTCPLCTGRLIVERLAEPRMDGLESVRYRVRFPDSSWIATDYDASAAIERAVKWRREREEKEKPR